MSGIDRAAAVGGADRGGMARRCGSGMRRAARPPAVDFAKQMVVGGVSRQPPVGRISRSQITGVRIEDDAIVVRWAETAPAPGQMAAQVMTAPSFSSTVPRHDGQVRFEKVGQ